ncbi:hypothetical protein L7F22_039697 [Adiantum nelumboides]|nr:hypothetical protein [Adiantum nelumboides]
MACNAAKLIRSLIRRLLSAVPRKLLFTCASGKRSCCRRPNYKQVLKASRCSQAAGGACKKGWLPVVCVGSSSCKRYTIALHQLRSPALLQLLSDTAAEYGYGFSSGGGALAIACEPHTFEATFCLLQRSCQGLLLAS